MPVFYCHIHEGRCHHTGRMPEQLVNMTVAEFYLLVVQGMDVIFMETAMRLSDARSHAVVDCIPVLPKVTAKAPLYFKKGIDDAESEWSQHHAKRMIETGGKVEHL